MKTIKIKINGKWCECRVVKGTEKRLKGDVYGPDNFACGEGIASESIGHLQGDYFGQAYRPLRPKKPKLVVRAKGFIAYGRSSEVGKFIRFEMTLDALDRLQAYRVIPIIKLRGKAGKK